MNTLVWIILSTVVVSVLSLIGVVTLMLRKGLIERIMRVLVAFSAGALMGTAFLHLIPEALENQGRVDPFLIVLISFSFFLLIGKILHWHHSHTKKEKICPFVWLNLFGDGVHNFIDGVVMAAAFVIDVRLGITTTVAVIIHEIPQEIGDFGILIYGGFSKARALVMNLISACTAVVGGIVGYFLSTSAQAVIPYLIPFAAGGFLYIAASDLIPELRKEMKLPLLIRNFVIFLLGIGLMYMMEFLPFQV